MRVCVYCCCFCADFVVLVLLSRFACLLYFCVFYVECFVVVVVVAAAAAAAAAAFFSFRVVVVVFYSTFEGHSKHKYKFVSIRVVLVLSTTRVTNTATYKIYTHYHR